MIDLAQRSEARSRMSADRGGAAGAECPRPKACREGIRAVRVGISVMLTNDRDELVYGQLIPPGAACGRTTLALSDQRGPCRRCWS